MSDWSHKSIEEVLEKFDVDAKSGLGSPKAEGRSMRYGRNRPDSVRAIGLSQLLDDRLVVLAATILCLAAGLLLVFSVFPIRSQQATTREPLLAVMLAALIFIVGLLRVLWINKKLNSLQPDHDARTKVRRDGKLREIAVSSIVPGDIVTLRSGQRVPADIRLLKVSELTINETFITGAPLPVEKRTFVTPPTDTLLEAQKNMAFAGSFITAGHGEGIVVAIGKNTELSKLTSASRRHHASRTTLQKSLLRHSRDYWIPILGASVLVFVLVFLREPNKYQVFRILESLVAAAALVIVVRPLSLSSLVLLGILSRVRRSSQKGLGLRNPAGFESLSSINVVCVDGVDEGDADAIHHLQSESGVRIIVFATARSAADKILDLNAGIDGDILSSAQIHHMSHQLLKKNVRFNSVYVVEDAVLKLRIVHALKSNGYRVAVVGSTSEDITAMKVADVAMTTTGVAADVVTCADLLMPTKQLALVHDTILDARRAVLRIKLFIRILVVYGVVLTLLMISSLTVYSDPRLNPVQLLLVGLIFSVVAPWIIYLPVRRSRVAQRKPVEFIK